MQNENGPKRRIFLCYHMYEGKVEVLIIQAEVLKLFLSRFQRFSSVSDAFFAIVI